MVCELSESFYLFFMDIQTSGRQSSIGSASEDVRWKFSACSPSHIGGPSYSSLAEMQFVSRTNTFSINYNERQEVILLSAQEDCL